MLLVDALGQDQLPPRSEFIDCPRCGQSVLKDNLSRQWNEWGQVCWCESCGAFDSNCHVFDQAHPATEQRTGPIYSELDRLRATTRAIRATAHCVTREFTSAPTDRLARLMESLTEQLISSLLPFLAAEQDVVCRRIDSLLGEALTSDHREVRLLTERLAMLSESVERSRRRAPEAESVHRALRELMTAVDSLEAHEHAAFCRLGEILPVKDQEELAAALQAATAEAREHTILVVRPAIPATAAHVLRNRPDLNAAYAMSLAEVDRRSARGAPGVGDR